MDVGAEYASAEDAGRKALNPLAVSAIQLQLVVCPPLTSTPVHTCCCMLCGVASCYVSDTTALEDDGLINTSHVQAAIRQQAGSTRDPEHVVVVDAFTGAVVVLLACVCVERLVCAGPVVRSRE